MHCGGCRALQLAQWSVDLAEGQVVSCSHAKHAARHWGGCRALQLAQWSAGLLQKAQLLSCNMQSRQPGMLQVAGHCSWLSGQRACYKKPSS